MYLTVSTIAANSSMRARVAACAAEQGQAAPESWAYQNAYRWASSPGWDDKWESAVAAENPTPGADPAVITDADILSTVQVILVP